VQKIWEIVLTGGPSSGKSSSLSYIYTKLSEWGYYVLVAPEVATMIFASGIADPEELSAKNRPAYVGVEKSIIHLQMDMRKQYLDLARLFPDKPSVILYDRAEIDARAYLSAEEFELCLSERGTNHTELRDSYHGVIHMRTVGFLEGARYDKDSNPQRREDRAGAIWADGSTLAAWLGHPNLHIVDPQEFQSKKESALAKIADILGRPPITRERRHLIKSGVNLADIVPEHCQRYLITQNYTEGSSPSRWSVLTRRETVSENLESTITYYRGDASEDTDYSSQMVRGRIITRDEYIRQLRSDCDPQTSALVKTRYAFREDGYDIELDHYESGLVLAVMSGDGALPDWVGEEVTTVDEYSTVYLGLNHA
jgi:hypothetical protein